MYGMQRSFCHMACLDLDVKGAKAAQYDTSPIRFLILFPSLGT